MLKKIIILLILVFLGLVFWRIAAKQPASAKRPFGRQQAEKITVKTVSVKREDLDFILSYAGGLKAKDEANVFSKVTGKLAQYLVSEGDAIEKGQTIALVDRDETGLKYELAKVESPISGIVGRTLLDKGANVLTITNILQGTPVAIIVNMDEMIVRLNVPEQDIPYIQKGLKAELKADAYPQENFTGEVSKVSQVVDTATRTLPIEISVFNPGHRLKSGMFCRINIVAKKIQNALVLPEDCLIQELGANYVFIVENNTARKKRVSTGIRQDNRIELLDSLEEGEKVIVFGQQGLKDGTLVEIVKGDL